jgi:glucan phosphoethanolaminetransferase (alkaline phosphatase superfamily)
MARVELHLVIYAVFIFSIIFDLATTALCFQVNNGVAETNLIYRFIGVWSFPIVLFLDALFVLATEWLRKYIRWSPLILLILIVASVRAGIVNINVILESLGG